MITAKAFLACLAFATAEAHAEPVDVELVLAVDVSESMDPNEFAIQRAGYVQALRDPAFIAAARSGLNGRVAITYFEWAGTVRTASIVPWHIIADRGSAFDFAAKLEMRPFNTFRGTSISSALTFGVSALLANNFEGQRLVIDLSGDGPNNFGPPVAAARDAAIAAGVTINGLPIMIRPSPIFPAMDRYYSQCVVGGPGAFVLPVQAVSEFGTAIRRKLILEVSGNSGDAGAVPVATEPPVHCMVGERARRAFSDRFYPELDR